jgi:hypothetical protein
MAIEPNLLAAQPHAEGFFERRDERRASSAVCESTCNRRAVDRWQRGGRARA